MLQRILVNRLQKAWPKCRVDLHCAANDFLCQFLVFHFDILSILLILSTIRSQGCKGWRQDEQDEQDLQDELLWLGHQTLAWRHSSPTVSGTSCENAMNATNQQRISQLELRQFFAEISGRMDPPDGDEMGLLFNQRKLREFFATVTARVELAEAEQRHIDRRLATQFNVFDLIEPDENRLSDILAWLLDPKGNHGQGDLFLRLLFKQLGLSSAPNVMKNAAVRREAPTFGILKYRRRIDVLVEAGVLLAIENKVDSLEQRDQVKDYLEHLRHCTQNCRTRSTLIYLSPDRRTPVSLDVAALADHQRHRRLYCWSYRGEIRAWLEDGRRECEAQHIRDFLSDFIGYIESALRPQLENIQQKEANDE
jgi:hypothetical protein